MKQEHKYSMLPPYREYTAEFTQDIDENVVDMQQWKKENTKMHNLHKKDTINLWEKFE